MGICGRGRGSICAPTAIAIDPVGNIYVTDKSAPLKKFFSDGTLVKAWSGPHSNTGGIAVDPAGKVLISFPDSHSVETYTIDGTRGNPTLRGNGISDGQFSFPTSVAFDPSGKIYVLDTGNNRIQKFDSDGKFITKLGSQGTGDGRFIRPSGLAVDSSGSIYVVDSGNNRIQKFTGDGEFITKWGSQGYW